MKKQRKILLLLSTVFLLFGTSLFSVYADEAAAASEDDIFTPSVVFSAENASSLPSDSNAALGVSSADRLDNDIVANNALYVAGGMNWLSFYTATDASSANTYILARANKDYATTGGNNYLQVGTASTEFCIGTDASAYYVVDIDIGTLTELIPDIDIQCMNRQTESGGGFPFSSQVKLGQYLESNEEWSHFTIVGDIKNDTLYAFVNGDLVYSGGKSWGTNGTGASGSNGQSYLFHTGFRLQFRTGATTAAVSEGNTVLIDDPFVRFYSSASEADNLITAIESGDLTGWSLYCSGRGGEKLPAAATVNGTDYSNENNFLSLLSSGAASGSEIEIRRDMFTDFTVNFPCTLTTNGYENYDFAVGYMEELISGSTYSVKYTEEKHPITLTINGVEVTTRGVLHGATLDTCMENSDETLDDTIVYGNGKVYTGVTWDDSIDWTTKIRGEYEITGTGTEVEGYVVHNGTSIVTSSYGTMAAALTAVSELYIILASDQELSAAITTNGTKHLYLNDNSITQNSGENHSIVISSTSKLYIQGPGTVNEPNATSTYSFIFSGQANASAYIELSDITVNTTHHFLQLRAGSAVVKNCTVNAFAAKASEMITVGERSTAAVNLDIIDSRLSFTHKTANAAVLKQIVNETDQAHVVNIKGSTITSQLALFDLSSSDNFTVNVTDSVMVAKALTTVISSSNTQTLGTINFIDNVYVNESLQNLDEATIDGLTLVNSNNHLAPLCYSKSYATVTWADNSTEYWADGSTPVRDGSFPIVSEVAAGESYDFSSRYETAPFSLKANLTLDSEISFNLYTTKDAVSCVTVNGEKMTATDKSIGGTVYDCFTVRMTPAEAVSAFDVIFTLADGNSVARTLSVADYAALLCGSDVSLVTRELVSATLNYIKSSAMYFGINADFTEINSLLASYPVNEFEIPSAEKGSSELDGYIDSVQLDVQGSLKLRFNALDGASLTGIKFTVNGREIEYTEARTYCEVSLRAYEMADTITVSIGDAGCTYSLAVYFTSAKALADSSTTAAPALSCAALFDDNRGDLATAMYSYAIAARAYSPVI